MYGVLLMNCPYCGFDTDKEHQREDCVESITNYRYAECLKENGLATRKFQDVMYSLQQRRIQDTAKDLQEMDKKRGIE